MLKAKSATSIVKNKNIEATHAAVSVEFLPLTATRLDHSKRYLLLGSPQQHEVRKILDIISKRQAGPAYFAAVNEISRVCERLRKKHSPRLTAEAVRPEIFGRLLREIAGMVLCETADPVRVHRSARLMTENAIRAMELMLQRLERDVSGVLSNEIGGRLMQIKIPGSDPHRRGQRVVILQFEDGPPFLYKPRPVWVDRELAGVGSGDEPITLTDLCRKWLRPAVQGGMLPAHRIIAAGPWHGYTEEIRTTDTSPFALPKNYMDAAQSARFSTPQTARLKAGDENRYWYSAGLLAGHSFTLGILDLHAENVITGISRATPDISPHAVDLEMAFGAIPNLQNTHLIGQRKRKNENRNHSHAAFDVPSFDCGMYSEDWLIEIDQEEIRPASRPWLGVRWIFPHLTQNSDGSFGYASNVCSFLRGFADQWQMLQSHSDEVSGHLKERLSNLPMRVVFKPTRSYMATLLNEKIGGLPIDGIAHYPRIPHAVPLVPAEIRQLQQLDIPYFFRVLGDQSNENIYWFHGSKDKHSPAMGLRALNMEPFWNVVQRQSERKSFVRAVVDIARNIAPAGPFDLHEPALGVRVVRTAEDSRLLIVLLLGERKNSRLTCRIDSDGSIEYWFD